jgi:hypothetical protein
MVTRTSLLIGFFQAYSSLAFPSTSTIRLQRHHSIKSSSYPSSLPTPSSPSDTKRLQSLLRDDAADENVLAYLPNRGQDLPLDFCQLVKDATIRYTTTTSSFSSSSFQDEDDLGGIQHIVDVIDFEYKVTSRPVMIYNATCSIYKSSILSKILSVCLFHQLPSPIVCEFLKATDDDDDENLLLLMTTWRQAMETDGWKAISFPDGIRVQLRPGQVCSTWNDDLPPRKVTSDMANQLLKLAHFAQPPPVLRSSIILQALEEEFSLPYPIVCTTTILNALEQEFSFPSFSRPSFTTISIPFFPNDKKITIVRQIRKFCSKKLRRIRFVTRRTTDKLNKAGRAGLLAYGFLNFALYAGGTLWQWHRIVPVPLPSLQQSQIQKLGKVLASVYIGSQVTKLPRIALAVALAPVANQSLEWLQTRLEVSEGTAFGILTVSLISSFVGVLAFLTIGSTMMA